MENFSIIFCFIFEELSRASTSSFPILTIFIGDFLCVLRYVSTFWSICVWSYPKAMMSGLIFVTTWFMSNVSRPKMAMSTTLRDSTNALL